MQITHQSASKIVVNQKETPAQLITLLACIGLIVLAPVFFPIFFPQTMADDIPGLAKFFLVILFFIIVGGAIYISQCFETYTFDKSLESYTIERITPFGVKKQTGHLRQVKQIVLESYDTEYGYKEFLILILEPKNRQLKLPVRTLSFKPAELQQFGTLLKNFLDVPVQSVQK